MTLGHENLDVYRLAIGYVAWVYEKAKRLNGIHRPARDQWLRASQSIGLGHRSGHFPHPLTPSPSGEGEPDPEISRNINMFRDFDSPSPEGEGGRGGEVAGSVIEAQSIPLNIAEGNGKTADADRRRYFEISRGSALECAAIQDVLVVGKALDKTESRTRKDELDRMAAMLNRLGGREYQVREDHAVYGDGGDDFDPDPDSDFDLEKEQPQLDVPGDA